MFTVTITKTYKLETWADAGMDVLREVIETANQSTLSNIESWVYLAWPAEYDQITTMIASRRAVHNAIEDEKLKKLGLSDDTLVAKQLVYESTNVFIGKA
jgi:uncharacterized membrane protein